jgi:hypothetical protein
MTSDQERKLLSPEEKTLVDLIAVHCTPIPLTAAQRVAFDQALTERIARRTRVFFLRPAAAVVATACAALLFWFAAPYQWPFLLDGGEQSGTGKVAREDMLSSAGEATLLTYAYDSPEFYGDEDNGDEESFLPDEYEALAVAFAIPGA